MKKRVENTNKKRQRQAIAGYKAWRIPKKKDYPPMQEVTIPKKLQSLIKAFSVDDQSARLLIIEAAKTIYGKSDGLSFCGRDISNEEVEGVLCLMRALAPQDALEMLYCAQIVSSHLLGFRLLRAEFHGDQILGYKLLRFSNEAMAQLQKKRSGGGAQNIQVTYNYNGHGPALMQTVIPKEPNAS